MIKKIINQIPKTCKIKDCHNNYRSLGLCNMHYKRWRKFGDTSRVLLIRKNPTKSFWAKVNKTASCWAWVGTKAMGYGQLRDNVKKVLAHRFSWELHNGKIPKGLHVLHKCDNRACVNPSHLFLGTHQDNMKDMVLKGRQAKGEQTPISKLTENNIIAIRMDCRILTEIAKSYNVTRSTISRVKRYETWKHIK